VRTAFNILGPVLNPARAAYALVGVYDPAISGLMADVLLRTGVSKALVVHSCGLDELTPMGAADIVEVRVAPGHMNDMQLLLSGSSAPARKGDNARRVIQHRAADLPNRRRVVRRSGKSIQCCH